MLLCFFISPSVRFPFLANGYFPRECWSPIWMAEAGIHVILARHWAGTYSRIMSHCDAWRGAGLCHIVAGHRAADYVTLGRLARPRIMSDYLWKIPPEMSYYRIEPRVHLTDLQTGTILGTKKERNCNFRKKAPSLSSQAAICDMTTV